MDEAQEETPSNVVRLVDFNGDCRSWDTQDALDYAKHEIETNKARKALVLWLEPADDEGEVPRYSVAGMTNREAIAALAIFQHIMLTDLFS